MLVSVIIPTRNRAEYVASAISSALDQTCQDLEVVVVDDASDDRTPQLLASLSESDKRLRVVRLPNRGGAPRARNIGASHARAEILAFLDDDCIWAPHKIERQLEYLGPEHGAVYCRQAIKEPDGQWVLSGGPGASEEPLKSLLRTNYIGTYTLLLRRETFESVGGFDEGLPRLQDWDLVLRLAHQTRFAFVPEILVVGHLLKGGISLTPAPLVHSAERILQRQQPDLTRRQRAALSYGLGKFLLVDGFTPAARRFMMSAVRFYPLSPINWLGLAATLLGPTPARQVRALRRRLQVSKFGKGPDWWSGLASDDS